MKDIHWLLIVNIDVFLHPTKLLNPFATHFYLYQPWHKIKSTKTQWMKVRNTKSISDKKSSIGDSIPPTAVDRKIDYWSATNNMRKHSKKRWKRKKNRKQKGKAAKTALKICSLAAWLRWFLSGRSFRGLAKKVSERMDSLRMNRYHATCRRFCLLKVVGLVSEHFFPNVHLLSWIFWNLSK